MIKKLEKIKPLIDRYNTNFPEEKKDINYLIKTYNRNFMNYNLYYHEDIINHQTINNLLFNSYDDFTDEVFKIFENNLNAKKPLFLYKELLGIKSMDKVKITEFQMPIKEYEIITPLFPENKDLEDKNKIYFCKYTLIKDEKGLLIYDKDKNIINNGRYVRFDKNHNFMIYNSNIIIVFTCFEFTILIFSDDYKSYKSIHIYLNDYNAVNDFPKNIEKRNYSLGIELYFYEKLIKLGTDKLIYLSEGNVYSMDIKKYIDKNLKHSSIKGELDKINSDKTFSLDLNSIYYKDSNNILQGFIFISLCYEKSRKIKVEMFNENLETINEIEFNYPFNKHTAISVLDINYNYLNNMILSIINSDIYQINPLTKEVTTIYNINSYIFNKGINLLRYNEGISFYNYNEKNEKFEQIIIIINKETNDIYQFYWYEKTLLLKQVYSSYNYKKISPLFNSYGINGINDGKGSEKNNQKKFNKGMLFIGKDDKLLIFN